MAGFSLNLNTNGNKRIKQFEIDTKQSEIDTKRRQLENSEAGQNVKYFENLSASDKDDSAIKAEMEEFFNSSEYNSYDFSMEQLDIEQEYLDAEQEQLDAQYDDVRSSFKF